MQYQVVTLFPEMIRETVQNSMIGRAIRNGLISVDTVCIRDYAQNRHGRVDDYPYGGGAGMVMEAEPVCLAVEEAQRRLRTGRRARVIYLTPQAEVLSQTRVEELAMEESLILLCGHYEGIDERALETVVTDYLSIGDYVLTGGELGALVLIDAVSRFVPGVLGNETSAEFESMKDTLLEYPHYTRPEVWRGKPVPEILLSGDHRRVEEWRHGEALRRTRERRPDLFARHREITCIWYGADAVGAFSSRLLQEMTQNGACLDYNRKKLQGRRHQFDSRDLVLLVTGPDPDPAPLRNVRGSETALIRVTVSEEPPAPDGGDVQKQNDWFFARGFVPDAPVWVSSVCGDQDVKRLGIALRRQWNL